MWNASSTDRFPEFGLLLDGHKYLYFHSRFGVYIEAFVDSLSSHESAIFREAFVEIKAGEATFSPMVQSALVSTMSRYSCRKVPKPKNVKTMILQASSYTFIIQPTAALTAIHSGVPQQHLSFWRGLGVMGLYSIYGAQSVSPVKVLKMFDDAEGTDANEERELPTTVCWKHEH